MRPNRVGPDPIQPMSLEKEEMWTDTRKAMHTGQTRDDTEEDSHPHTREGGPTRNQPHDPWTSGLQPLEL